MLFFARVPVQKVANAPESQVVRGRCEEEYGVFGTMCLKIFSEAHECGDATRHFSAGCLRGYDRHGVVVGVDDYDFFLHYWIRSFDPAQYVGCVVFLPGHPGFELYFYFALVCQQSAQLLTVFSVDPESLYGVGYLQKFCFGLCIRCGIWRDENDLLCAQNGGVEPFVPGVKVE